MFRRLKTTSLAGGSALALVLAVSGVVASASVLTAIAAPEADPTEPTVVDTTLTFEDVNGNGVDDDCEDDESADEAAALAADLAVDLDGDGTVSVSEAAQSDRTGGDNCNHGGYVSNVAQGTCDEATGEDETATDGDEASDTGEATDGDEASDDSDADCEATEVEETTEDVEETTEDTATCEAAEGEDTAPVDEPVTETDVDEPKNHGEVVSKVAQDESAVGGKNCNHGGAVSEASHADNDARKEAREAAKEAREAERAAAKAARDAAKGSKGKGHNR
jgi:hypothetical protein